MFTADELIAIFNILVQRPYAEVANLIVRIDQEYRAVAPAPEPALDIDINQGNAAA
jgi:hypothetical protein